MAGDDLVAPAVLPEEGAPDAPAADAKPTSRRFRKPFNAVRLSPDQARRQGRIAQVAWTALGGRDAVMAFLNAHDDELDGRPLDVAVESDAGLARVEAILAARA